MDDQASSLRELLEAFRVIGVEDAETWARSELEEGVPQLAICLFLALANGPIDRLIDPRTLREMLKSTAPRSAVDSLDRLFEAGPSEDVLQVVRWALRAYLTEMCFLLDDTSARVSDLCKNRTLANTHWGLFRTSEPDRPDAQMNGLHEVVSEFFTGKV
jgi:hypothetical protein